MMSQKKGKLIRLIALIPLWAHRKFSNRQFLMIGAAVVGLWAGLISVILKISVHYLQEGLRYVSQFNHNIYLISPAIGILLTLFVIHFILRNDLAKGTWHVLLSIAKKSSNLPRKETYSHAVTSALTVGLGGSVGLESPIVQTGSAIGSTFASFFSLSYRDRTLLLACGASAGIAAAFNAPIAGVLFALEVLLVDISITSFIPLLIAGATGALFSEIILSEEILFSFKQVSNFDYRNVPYYLLLGISCGLVSVFYARSLCKTEALFSSKLQSPWLRYSIGSLLLGIMIMLFPALFGEGYDSVKALAVSNPQQLFAGSPLNKFLTQSSIILGISVLAIGLVKVFAVSFTLSAGGNGGNFAPSLLVGACLGFSFAFTGNVIGLDLPVSNFCLVGMAGILTGIFHTPLTAIFLIAEITGGYGLMIPLMVVAALSTAVSRYLQPLSLDEIKLKLATGTIVFNKESQILSEILPARMIEKDFATVPVRSTLRVLVEVVSQSRRNIFAVIDKDRKLAGIILLDDIREIMFDAASYDILLVEKIMQKPIVVADIQDDMSTIMEKFDKSGLWNIPVVNNGEYIGFISKSSLFTDYRKKLKS